MNLLSAGLAGLLLTAPTAAKKAEPMEVVAAQDVGTVGSKKVIEEAWSKGNYAVLQEVIDAAYVGHNPDGKTESREQLKERLAGLRKSFPDLKVTVEDVVASGEKIVLRWKATGTQRGDFKGIIPTNKPVEFEGVTIDRLAKGKVVESWSHMDSLGIIVQLRGAGVENELR